MQEIVKLFNFVQGRRGSFGWLGVSPPGTAPLRSGFFSTISFTSAKGSMEPMR
jgi:hypothetical protein